MAAGWPFHPVVSPHCWPAARPIQLRRSRWVGLLSDWSNTGGFITLPSNSCSPDWGPSGREKGCQRELALQPLTVCLYEIKWVSICLRRAGLCYHNLLRSLSCWGGATTVHFRISVRNEEMSPCRLLDDSDISHLSCNGLWHQSVIWANSEAAGARFAGCGPDGHEYGNKSTFSQSQVWCPRVF